MPLRLEEPDVRFKKAYLAAMAEYRLPDANGRLDSVTYAARLGYDETRLSAAFGDFVRDLGRVQDRRCLPPGWRPERIFWAFEGDRYIGEAAIRSEEDAYILTVAGHIGFEVRPSARGKGYGRGILTLSLARAAALGLLRVLVTCDVDNIASRRTIERCGGVPAEGLLDPETGRWKLRYWFSVGVAPPSAGGHNAPDAARHARRGPGRPA